MGRGKRERERDQRGSVLQDCRSLSDGFAFI